MSMNIEYKRKDKTYFKAEYIIMANYMIANLENTYIIQYFTDVTYYVIPSVSKKYKIFSLLGFDVKEKKTKLCTLALIQNENYETFGALFLHLKNTFDFSPKYITSEFNKGLIKAINRIFPEIRFFFKII